MTTMSDVARAAGVSVMTVSNVLNDKPNVGAATRARVLEVVEELGYAVNLTARRLREGRSGTIAWIVPNFGHLYFGEIAALAAAAVEARGRHLVVEQSGASSEGEQAALSMARLATYDGVLLSVVGMSYEEVDALTARVPMVLLGEQRLPDRFDQVRMDNRGGARLATEHLIAGGARTVLVVGGATWADAGMSGERTAGWRAALEAAGLPAGDDLVVELADLESATARAALAGVIAAGREFDAVFAVTDQVALGVLAALAEAGVAVPEQVQVVGFDNLALGAQLHPGLTTIDPANEWIVSSAVDLLERQIDGEADEPRRLISPVSLVARGTTLP